MSTKHKQDLTKVHKCIASKCKGRKIDPPDAYGYWAWWDPAKSGWVAKKPE